MEPFIVQAEPTAKEVNQAIFEHRCNTVVAPAFFVILTVSTMVSLYGTLDLYKKFQIPAETFYFAVALPFVLSFLYFRAEKTRDWTGGQKQLTIKYVFTDDGIQFIDAHGTSFVKWADVTRGYDCVNSLALVINTAVFVLPKRNFKDGKELKEIRQTIKKHVSNFNYARGSRPDVVFENTYQKSIDTTNGEEKVSDQSKKQMLPVEVQLDGPESAKVTLKCKYICQELSEFQWRYVNKKITAIRAICYFSVYSLFFQFWLFMNREPMTDFDWVGFVLIALGSLGFYLFKKSQRFKTVPAFYGSKYRAVMQIGNDLVLFKAKGLEASVRWNEFSEVHETTRFFVLKTQHAILFIIPKRALNDEYKRVFVENLLRRKKIKESKEANAS